MSDRHVMEALGMSRVVIEDGKVVDVSEPKVKYCPLFKKYRNIDELNKDSIRKNIEFRISDFGMCTEDRDVKLDYFLSFGISEVMSLAMKNGTLDAVVLASDGCGTVVLTDPCIIQGMGGRISGIMETTPLHNVIDAIGKERVLDPETAKIDQIAGVAKAVSMGYDRIGVTVARAEDARFLRKRYGDRLTIFAVHTTGISKADAETYFDCCDVITACASKYVREIAAGKAKLQAGTKVPIYSASERGTELMMDKLNELGKKPDTVLEDGPRPLL